MVRPAGLGVRAYERAWEEREKRGNESEELLTTAFSELGAGSQNSDELDVYLGFWRRGVPPAKLGSVLVRAQFTAAWSLVRSLFRGSGRVPRWMIEPKGIELVGWKDWDSRVEKLEFRPDPSSQAHLDACAAAPVDEAGEQEVPIWLRMTEPVGTAEVLVGKFSIGTTKVSDDDWRMMRDAATRGLYSDGSLEISTTNGKVTVVSMQGEFPSDTAD